MSLLLVLIAWMMSAFAGTMTLDMLDVGQGDSLLLRSPDGKAVLIDAGEGSTDVASQLAGLGIGTLSLVIATHPHADHIGGMAEVLARYPVKLYIDNGMPHTTETYARVMRLIEQKAIPYKPAKVGQIYTLDDGIKLEVLNPADKPLRGTRSDLNANSVVVRVTHGSDCILLTGDSEADTEVALLGRGLQPCAVLKVAHHGSAYSSGTEFIEAVQPKFALISVGSDNNYGHPSGDTMQRLERGGAEVHRTDLEHGLRVESSGHGVKLVTGIVVAEPPGPVAAAPAAAAPAAAAPDAAVAPAKTPAGPSADANAGCAYLSSSQSEVFHEANCGTGARISADKRMCFATREAAIAAGKRPAGCCHP